MLNEAVELVNDLGLCRVLPLGQVNIALENFDQLSEGGVARLRLWWNWQTRYFEVVVGKPVQVQVLLSAPNPLLYSSAITTVELALRAFRSTRLREG